MSNNFKPLKVLLFGYIDTNVIDGSAFFLPAMANMLTSLPNVEVDLLLARPVRRLTVLQEVLGNHKVNVIDPFDMAYPGQKELDFLSKKTITLEEAAELLNHHSKLNDYDVKIIRSTEVTVRATHLNPNFAANCLLYVTGVVNASHEIDPEVINSYDFLNDSGCSFLLQTTEMLNVFRNQFIKSSKMPISAVAVYPMVPDIADDFSSAFTKKDCYKDFVYTGKFVREWNPTQILSAMSEIRSIDPEVNLSVAGDQFRKDLSNDSFVEEVQYLLKNTDGVTWHGGVEREQARALIGNADVGISWRHPDLDDSLELSTKLLEYGTLAKPCIMNRTPMHERLFGTDYPLYANSMTEFTDRLSEIVTNPKVVEFAAERSFRVSLDFTYSRAARRVLPLIVEVTQKATASEDVFDINDPMVVSLVDHSPASFLKIAAEKNATSVSAVLGPFLLLEKSADREPDNSRSMDLLDFYVDWRAALRVTTTDASRNVTVKNSLVKHANGIHGSKSHQTQEFELSTFELSRELETQEDDAKKLVILNGEIQRRGRTIENLKLDLRKHQRDCKVLEQQLQESTTRLNALRASRLGKIQVAIWSRRK